MAKKKEYHQFGVRRIIALRHGQKPSSIWGRGWLNGAIQNRRYTPYDANLPDELLLFPRRPLSSYRVDEPLTKFGHHLAESLRQACDRAGIEIDSVFTSPAYRCVETTDSVVPELQIKIDASLYENFLEPGEHFPSIISPNSLENYGFNVDVNYRPQQRKVRIDMRNPERHRERFDAFIDDVIASEDGTVLISGLK